MLSNTKQNGAYLVTRVKGLARKQEGSEGATMKTYAIKCGQCENDQLVTEADGDMRQLLDVHDHRVVIAPVHQRVPGGASRTLE